MTVTTGSTAVTLTTPEASVRPGSLAIQLRLAGGVTAIVFDDGNGSLIPVTGVTDATAGTVNYATGAIALTLAANAVAGDVADALYRYEFSDTVKPAQALLEWVSELVKAEPYRLRSTYNLDNFYQVKQVLSGYNIDQVLSTSLAGFINKEISGSVFDDMLLRVDADYVWDSANPTGVSWAMHRLSALQTFVRGGNGIRKNIARSGGNVAVCGTEWMNYIETLGDDTWKPVSYGKEPIGPYEAGELLGRFKIIKNQDYPDTKAAMGYKSDDTDASLIGGVFIGLYSTQPLPLDDLSVIQGMGTQFGWKKAFENSLISLTLI
jgi:hypothetical protein